MEYKKRHQFFWGLLSFLSRVLVKIKFNFQAASVNPEGPYIVLSNHVTDWDPLMVGSAFKRQMYFVASEHIYRLGFLSKLLRFFLSPIARQKGGNAAGTVKSILRTLKSGYNVCLFPEGNRSWDGKTGEFTSSTGKLVKSSGASLVTYRLKGGYFSSPRWAGKSIRKGKVTGELVGVYTPEQLKTMSVSEVNAVIAADLYVDAYADQLENPVKYTGACAAEHLETYLFACPVCGALHKLKSDGSRFYCGACGAAADYTDFGYLKGAFPYETVSAWASWQDGIIDKLCAEASADAIFADDNIQLLQVESAHGSADLGVGYFRLFADRIELPGGTVIPGSEIGGMAIRGDSMLFISTNENQHYQLTSTNVFNAQKYLLACRKLGFISSFV